MVEVLVVPSLRHVYFELSAGRFRSQMITEIQGILLAIGGSFCGQSQTTKTGREVPAVGGFVLLNMSISTWGDFSPMTFTSGLSHLLRWRKREPTQGTMVLCS